MCIDAHIHFWRTTCGFDNKPVADHAAYRRDFMPSEIDAELAACGIDSVILVQTCPQVEETDWILDLAEDHKRIVGVTGWIDLDRPACDVASLLQRRKLVGVRAQLRRIADPAFVTRPHVVDNLARVLEAGLALTILAEPRHYTYVLGALDALPAGPVTVNHLGMRFPDIDRGQWRDMMRRLAGRPQTFVQLSGLPFLYGENWRSVEGWQVLEDAMAILGPERLLFASDWPMMLRFATYTEWVRTIEHLVDSWRLSPAEAAAIWGGNALRANPRLATAHSSSSITPENGL